VYGVLDATYFKKKHVIIEEGEWKLKVFYTENTSEETLEELRFLLQRPFELVKLDEKTFSEKLEKVISEDQDSGEFQEVIPTASRDSLDLLKSDSEAPVVNFINRTIIKAVRLGASDIHFDPGEKNAVVRLRLDGILQEYKKFPMNVYNQVVSRIKVMANLNVAEKLMPQDGRIRIKLGGEKELDIRVSVLPTIFGERVVLRLLDQSNKLLTLEQLGLSRDDYLKVEALAKKPYGLILVTGPTGAGKSTTLYAMLLLIKEIYPYKNIITIEDPVEYQVSGIAQVQVNPKVGLTFAAGLRSILRQDPDVILVGEIRDKETAQISVHAALTGHLVLSTLHTNDAPTAITRLADMGIEPYLIASSLEGVISQRLVRTICSNCKFSYTPSKEEVEILKKLGKTPKELFKGEGCELCLGSGYRGRTGIFEVLTLDEELKKVVVNTVEANEIRERARKKGFKLLQEDGLKKVLKGITTLSEYMSVIEKSEAI